MTALRGAVSALPAEPPKESAGLPAQDAQLDACQANRRGRQTMTVYKSIKAVAYSAVISTELARGEKIAALTGQQRQD